MLAVLVLGFIFLIRRTVRSTIVSGAVSRWWAPRTEVLLRYGLWTWLVIDLPVSVGLSDAHINAGLHWFLSIPLTLAIVLPWAGLRMKNADVQPDEFDPSLADLSTLAQEQRDSLGGMMSERRIPPLPLWIDLIFALGCMAVGVGTAYGLWAALGSAHADLIRVASVVLQSREVAGSRAVIHWIGTVAVTYFMLRTGGRSEDGP